MNRAYPFVLRTYEGKSDQEKALLTAAEADVVILGSAPWGYLQERLAQKKLTFIYSERLYKKGYERWKWPVRMWRHYWRFGRHKRLYLLCASAYTAYDFSRTFAFLNKAYKWGYFPAVQAYDVEQLLERKSPRNILWAGRFLNWKHPEHAIEVARRLRAEGYDFRLTMLGNGQLLETIRQQVAQLGLEDAISLPGAVPAEAVRSYMEEAGIYLFTSDRNEGWGAVLNESMNSGCAVVACKAIGSVPFLIRGGENGLTYDNGDVEQLYSHVKNLLDDAERCRALGWKAYETMAGQWNADEAAKRLLALSETLMQGEKHPKLFEEGPCSKAEIQK
jgi:glycosyltransferase involved in cell wall biosynthesis